MRLLEPRIFLNKEHFAHMVVTNCIDTKRSQSNTLRLFWVKRKPLCLLVSSMLSNRNCPIITVLLRENSRDSNTWKSKIFGSGQLKWVPVVVRVNIKTQITHFSNADMMLAEHWTPLMDCFLPIMSNGERVQTNTIYNLLRG